MASIIKVPDNLSHFSRHDLAYFETRSSIFLYMSHVSMKLRDRSLFMTGEGAESKVGGGRRKYFEVKRVGIEKN